MDEAVLVGLVDAEEAEADPGAVAGEEAAAGDEVVAAGSRRTSALSRWTRMQEELPGRAELLSR